MQERDKGVSIKVARKLVAKGNGYSRQDLKSTDFRDEVLHYEEQAEMFINN